METYEGWASDPFGTHEARFFRQGRPTELVRDGSVESFDTLPEGPTQPPAPSQWSPPAAPSQWSPPAEPSHPAGSWALGSSAQGSSSWAQGLSSETFIGGTAPTPSRHPKRRLLAGSAVLVVAALAGSLVVLSGGKSAEAAVIDSVNSTLNDRTAHISMNLAAVTPSGSVTGTGTGGINFSQNEMQLQMSVNENDQQITVQALYIAGSLYESIPGLNELVPGKSWISIDLSSLGAASGQSPGALGTGNDPTMMLRLLAQHGNKVVPLGPSSIDGAGVQGYSVKLDPDAIKAELAHANLPSWMTVALGQVNIQGTIKVYIDGSGLLRRFSTALTETVASTGKVTVDESLDFSDYGTAVNVSAPPTDQVVSFQQFLQDAAAAVGHSSSS